jgi:hypothetical protein
MTYRHGCAVLLALLAGLATNPVAAASDDDDADSGTRPACNPRGNPHDCRIDVAITEAPDGLSCSIVVALESVEFVDEQSNRNRRIYWQLTGAPGYAFATDGVRFKNDPGGNFDDFKLKNRGQVFRLRNRNAGSDAMTREWEYGVKVYRVGGGPVCEVDPFIRNVRI